MQLKYTGKLGYYEARYRLGLGNKDKLLVLIQEEKNKTAKPSTIEIFEKVWYKANAQGVEINS